LGPAHIAEAASRVVKDLFDPAVQPRPFVNM